ncbi:hypothetical protein HNQ02_003798 [Flavobacterium sp. 7E]|uniref:hypothetical protein n=1 Tax=Flavobacterium sp. 7E TaxID=2735898 RepID=UPI00156EFF99|nr:hypothetical protein [Flavobacterium sp. 7E]NRS90851.1 hypothetical protein [Flavobacterium sp. 7E]
MIVQKTKIIIVLFSLLFVLACKTSKKVGEGEYDIAFKNYLETRKIDIKNLNDGNYTDYYLEFLNDKKKKIISDNHYLKVDKVYVYQGGKNKITFCVFSDDGNEYMSRLYKADRDFLTEPENGIIKLKQEFKLEFLGNFELNDKFIKISRNIRELSGKEFNEGDLGRLENDTIRLIENYDTKKYEYKKKWLAKTYKTDYKFVYQPNLKVTKHEADKTHNAYYLIEGTFNVERNLEEEKMLDTLEKGKYQEK